MGVYIWNAYALIPGIAIIIQILLAIMVLAKNREWVIVKMFFLMSMLVMTWNIGAFMLRLTNPDHILTVGSFWAKFGIAGLAFGTAAVLHFSLVTCRFYEKKKYFNIKDSILYIPSIIFFAFTMSTDLIVSGATEQWWGLAPVINYSPWWYVYNIFLLSFSITGINFLYRVRKKVDDTKSRTELNWFIIALTLSLTFGIASELILPGIFYVAGVTNVAIPELFSVGIALAAIFLGYAILKYQLFDIKVHMYLRRGLIYVMLSILALIFFGIIIFIIFIMMGDNFLNYQHFFYFGILVIVLIMFRQFEKGATGIVERLFPTLKWKECEVGEVFLIHSNGLLISHVSISTAIKVDRDLVAGMLTSLQQFIGDTLESDKVIEQNGLKVLTYSNIKLLIEHGKYYYIVVVFTGYEVEAMRKDIVRLIGVIEKYYSNVLKNWDGNTSISGDINPIIKETLSGKY